MYNCTQDGSHIKKKCKNYVYVTLAIPGFMVHLFFSFQQ